LGAWLVASVSVGRQEMIEFKGSHFEWEVILGRPVVCGLSDQLPPARGNDARTGRGVDHSTLNRCARKYVPLLD